MSENKNISNMLAIIKISIIVFIMTTMFLHIPEYWGSIKIENNGEFNIYTILIFFIITFIGYVLWKIMSKERVKSDIGFKIKCFVEYVLFILMISIPVYSFYEYYNEYKYIFLLLILLNSIQYGSKYGIITSILSSVIILTSDLIYAPIKNGINMSFQSDIIVS